jgi:uncharacterized damage-inducible protein DinB
MELLDYLHKLFAYDDWANREALASLRAAGTPPARSLKLMAHIVAAGWLWMARLGQEERRIVVWPELSVAECGAHIAELRPAWQRYLAGLSATRLGETIAYVNSKGERWTNTVGDILMHVVMHSTYHRAQIASDLRAHGHTPAYTDFIEGVRRKRVG